MNDSSSSPASRLERLVLLARAYALWEVLWHALAAVLVAAGLFVALAWLGVLADLPAAIRAAAAFLCAAAGIALSWLGLRDWRRNRFGRSAALARIDAESGFTHGQARAFDDRLANGESDPATAALWRVHRARLEARLRDARVGAPHPRLARADLYALRAGVLVFVIAAAFVAGEDRRSRLSSALDWGKAPAAPVAGLRLDAWIDPPAYTGRAPIVLAGPQNGAAESDPAPIQAPSGSTIVVRGSDPARLAVETSGGIEPKPADPAAKPDGSRRFVLRGDGVLSVSEQGGPAFRAEISAIPDRPPGIELVGQPRANARGSLTLRYKLTDDYGVTGAEATFAAPEIDGKPVTGRSLVPPPRIGLALPPGANGLGDAETTADLSEHPWAGARAAMTLHAHDEAGNQGSSAPAPVLIPQRRFVKSLARALVEQRRNLVLYPDRRERVHSALEALAIAPDLFGIPASHYLGLRVGTRRLADARNDADLVSVADYLWSMAVQIEDGDLSEAERDLRAAEKELRDALARNAPEDEIRNLMENLRAAMDKFLAQMAERQQREAANDPEGQQAPSRNSRMISRDDLKAMMDRIEQMARAGNLADAQRMLEQMQSILENLRTAKRRPRDPAAREMSRALEELDALTREQQQLRDDTYREGQEKRAGKQARRQKGEKRGQNGAQPQPGGDDPSDDDAGGGDEETANGAQPGGRADLEKRQRALRDRLGEVQRRMGRARQKSPPGLGEADQAMKDAEDALGEEGQEGEGQQGGGKKPGQGRSREAAVDAQGRAIEALRQAGQNLAQQMRGQGQGQAQGEGYGDDDMAGGEDGDGEPPSGQPRTADGERADPLGRPTSRDPLYNSRSRYDPMGASPALRAQRVLEELRRRLGDTSRPQDEVDYLERLLRRY